MLGITLLMIGCNPSQHSIFPYESNPQEAHKIESQALQICRQKRGNAHIPPRAFTTDGCSIWPDQPGLKCCVAHDMLYWCGGSAQDRDEADEQFRKCLSEEASPALGGLMYWGVRLGGSPWLPFPWRWGYGWDWLEGNLTNEKESQ